MYAVPRSTPSKEMTSGRAAWIVPSIASGLRSGVKPAWTDDSYIALVPR